VRFSRVVLKNFRSFGPDQVEITLPGDANLLALVGANNAGKSNLIDAIRLALSTGRRYEPNPADFHRLDVTSEMLIEVHLREPLRRENIFRGEDEVWGFYLRAWQSDRAPDKGQLKGQHYCLDASGKTFRQATVAGRRRAEAGKSRDTEPLRHDPPAASTVVRQLGRVHHLSPSLYRAFDTTGYGVLAQLLDLYREDFQSARNVYRHPTTGKEMTRAEAYERIVQRMEEILRTEMLGKIESALSQSLRAILGPTATGAKVSMALPTADELLARALQLDVQDDEHSPRLSVDRLGAGYQSLLRVAILRTYAELAPEDKPAVFLIEEPEAYLNPHLRRFFRSTLARLAEAGNDVFITTHDPAFVSLTEYRTVTRVAKAEGRSSTYRCTEALDFAYERLAQKLRRGGNAEVLFAQHAILCEGQDDVAVVKVLLERLGCDPDSRSISVVDCGGRENLPDYIRLLDELHVGLSVISDGDQTKAATNPKIADDVKKVADAAGARAYTFVEDLEAGLETMKQGSNTAHLVELVESLDLDNAPQEIVGLVKILVDVCPPAPTDDTTRGG